MSETLTGAALAARVNGTSYRSRTLAAVQPHAWQNFAGEDGPRRFDTDPRTRHNGAF